MRFIEVKAQELSKEWQKKETDLPRGGRRWVASIPVLLQCGIGAMARCPSWRGSLGRFGGGETPGPGLGRWEGGGGGAETEGWDVLGREGLTAPVSLGLPPPGL